MSSQPEMPQKAPYVVDVTAGDTYYWCACGKSKTQPYCDGSHKGTDFSPVAFTAEKTQSVFLCGCKQTGHPPYCDATHASL